MTHDHLPVELGWLWLVQSLAVVGMQGVDGSAGHGEMEFMHAVVVDRKSRPGSAWASGQYSESDTFQIARVERGTT